MKRGVGSLRRHFEFATRSPDGIARRTQSRRGGIGSATCGAKNSHRFANLSLLLPERHEDFAWAGVAQAKRFYCLRMSVCVCG
jgi:hypothetical protein